MPASKRQKSGLRDSGVFVDSDSDDTTASSPRPHKSARNALTELSTNVQRSPRRELSGLQKRKRASPRASRKDSKDENHEPSKSPSTEQKSKKDTKESIESPKEDEKVPDSHTYIAIHRPFFDYDLENWQAWTDGLTDRLPRSQLLSRIYGPAYKEEEEAGITSPTAPAEQHLNHKWVMMFGAYEKYNLLRRKEQYADPDKFGLLLHSHWQAYGVQEIAQTVLAEFDKAFRSNKKKERVQNMWTAISALGLWLAEDDTLSLFIHTDDAERTMKLVNLLGCALLTVLHELDLVGALKPDSEYKDLALVIAYYLELCHDLPAYGIEGDCVAWRKEAIAYFHQAKLDPKLGLASTALRLEKLANAKNFDHDTGDEGATENNLASPTRCKHAERIPPPPLKHGEKEHDRWKWDTCVTAFKKLYTPDGKLGGQHYDITKMTREQRAAAHLEGKDPLADVPVWELKNNMIELE